MLVDKEPKYVNLSRTDSSELIRGASLIEEACWYFVGLPLLRSHFITSSPFRCWLLRRFRARVGKGCNIKPGVRVKFPWYLEMGDHVWIGEDAWIDNLAQVTLESNVCLSQGCYLCTGNHDWSSSNMRLFRRPITCEAGSWIGARSVVCPGVIVGTCAVLTAGSTANKSIPPFEIHAGNPASFIRTRRIHK